MASNSRGGRLPQPRSLRSRRSRGSRAPRSFSAASPYHPPRLKARYSMAVYRGATFIARWCRLMSVGGEERVERPQFAFRLGGVHRLEAFHQFFEYAGFHEVLGEGFFPPRADRERDRLRGEELHPD